MSLWMHRRYVSKLLMRGSSFSQSKPQIDHVFSCGICGLHVFLVEALVLHSLTVLHYLLECVFFTAKIEQLHMKMCGNAIICKQH